MSLHPMTSQRLEDMTLVMGERGVARRCFCMHWRRPDGGYGNDYDNRDRFAAVIADDQPPGLLGYIGPEPVGWVQVGPRADFPTLQRSKLLKPIDEVAVWAINCFVVKVGHRRKGVGRGLLAGAIAYAKHLGAAVLEAYPVDGSRSSGVDYFTGTLEMFSREGFVEMIRRNETRPIVRLTLTS